MKTPEEIREWLQKQKWYPQFVDNLKNQRESAPYEHILCGILKERTISSAFRWGFTPEGFYFWNYIENQFLKWYNEEETKC